MTEALKALALEYGDYRSRGYRVERYEGTGGGWLLYAADGAQLMIGGYGGIAPTKAAAELEAYRRIDSDERLGRVVPATTNFSFAVEARISPKAMGELEAVMPYVLGEPVLKHFTHLPGSDRVIVVVGFNVPGLHDACNDPHCEQHGVMADYQNRGQ